MKVQWHLRPWLLLALGLMLVLVGCGGQGAAPTTGDSGGNQGGTSQDQQTFKLTYNITFPPPAYEWEAKAIAVEDFAKLVEEKTNGRVKIDIYYSNQLVPQNEALEAMQSGTIDLLGSGPYWGDRVPTNDFLWLPYWSKGEDFALHMLRNTDIGKIFEENLEKNGVKVLFYWPASVEGFISKNPVRTTEDLKGQKFRMGSGIWKSWYDQLGAAPVNVAAAEQYEALLRGTMDGTAYPYYTIDTYKFYEVTNYITVPGMIDPIMCLTSISTKTWEKLPADVQEAILEAAAEIEPKTLEGSKRLTDETIAIAEKHGIEVIKLTKEQLQQFQDSARIVWDEFAERNSDTKKMVEIWEMEQAKWSNEHPEAKDWEAKWLAD